MKTTLRTSLRLAALSLALAFVPALSAKSEAAKPADRAAQLLATQGSIPLEAAGPYVRVGTFQVQVSAKLGRPSAALPDGTWLYDNYTIPQSSARGTLVVRFEKGRASHLSTASAVTIAALRDARAATSPIVAQR